MTVVQDERADCVFADGVGVLQHRSETELVLTARARSAGNLVMAGPWDSATLALCTLPGAAVFP